MSLLERAWEQREAQVYPAMFGQVSRGIFPLGPGTFSAFGEVEVDPRWLTHGVFEFAPTETRRSWLYVTSGYSNPWEAVGRECDEDSASGNGVEFILETDRQGDWAILALQRFLAFELVLAAGQLDRGEPLGINDRIPLGGPIDGVSGHSVTHVAVTSSDWPEFRLVSGAVMFVQFVGLTDAEAALAKSESTAVVLQRLKDTNVGSILVPDRESLV